MARALLVSNVERNVSLEVKRTKCNRTRSSTERTAHIVYSPIMAISIRPRHGQPTPELSDLPAMAARFDVFHETMSQA